MLILGQNRSVPPFVPDALALEANAARAGLALGCRYSSSDEYEAEIIRVRRAAGAYKTMRPYRLALIALFAVTALLFVLMAII